MFLSRRCFQQSEAFKSLLCRIHSTGRSLTFNNENLQYALEGRIYKEKARLAFIFVCTFSTSVYTDVGTARPAPPCRLHIRQRSRVTFLVSQNPPSRSRFAPTHSCALINWQSGAGIRQRARGLPTGYGAPQLPMLFSCSIPKPRMFGWRRGVLYICVPPCGCRRDKLISTGRYSCHPGRSRWAGRAYTAAQFRPTWPNRGETDPLNDQTWPRIRPRMPNRDNCHQLVHSLLRGPRRSMEGTH